MLIIKPFFLSDPDEDPNLASDSHGASQGPHAWADEAPGAKNQSQPWDNNDQGRQIDLFLVVQTTRCNGMKY